MLVRRRCDRLVVAVLAGAFAVCPAAAFANPGPEPLSSLGLMAIAGTQGTLALFLLARALKLRRTLSGAMAALTFVASLPCLLNALTGEWTPLWHLAPVLFILVAGLALPPSGLRRGAVLITMRGIKRPICVAIDALAPSHRLFAASANALGGDDDPPTRPDAGPPKR